MQVDISIAPALADKAYDLGKVMDEDPSVRAGLEKVGITPKGKTLIIYSFYRRLELKGKRKKACVLFSIEAEELMLKPLSETAQRVLEGVNQQFDGLAAEYEAA